MDEDFRIYLLNHDRAKRTIFRHLYNLKRLREATENLEIPLIDKFFADLKAKGDKNSTINLFIETLRCYAAFAERQDILDYFHYRKMEPYERGTLSEDEVEAFLSLPCPKRGHPKSWNLYTTYFKVLFLTGLRPTEGASLEIDDIDFGLEVIHIKHGKTEESVGKVPLPDILAPELQKYIQGLDGVKLFPSIRHGNQGEDGILDIGAAATHFGRRCKMLGIRRANLSSHSARHTYGTLLAGEDVNLFTIKNLMRHKKITTTERYLHDSDKAKKIGQAKLPMIKKYGDPHARLVQILEEIKRFNLTDDERFIFSLVETSDSLELRVAIKAPKL